VVALDHDFHVLTSVALFLSIPEDTHGKYYRYDCSYIERQGKAVLARVSWVVDSVQSTLSIYSMLLLGVWGHDPSGNIFKLSLRNAILSLNLYEYNQ